MSAPKPRHGIILVADDNESNRELLSSLLTDEGYQVISATDGQQAPEQMSADSIDVVLLDVVMPRKSGFDVCLDGSVLEEFEAAVHGYEPVQPVGSAG